MMYKTIGTIEFFADLTLINATWEITDINFSLKKNEVSVVVDIYDNGGIKPNTRSYTFSSMTPYSVADATNAILGLDCFKNSITI